MRMGFDWKELAGLVGCVKSCWRSTGRRGIVRGEGSAGSDLDEHHARG